MDVSGTGAPITRTEVDTTTTTTTRTTVTTNTINSVGGKTATETAETGTQQRMIHNPTIGTNTVTVTAGSATTGHTERKKETQTNESTYHCLIPFTQPVTLNGMCQQTTRSSSETIRCSSSEGR
mmetsp:Transcript_44421/g.51234  ORF Transcript_44421/g.51234 Transcript_44421/m.51234 type:complete len:124 (+) Transcript_44421:70-441(+)